MIEAGLEAELRDALPRIVVEARRPAGPAGLREVLGPWFATFPQPERGDGEWEAFWQRYDEVCGHQPFEALRGAMVAWAKRPDAEFLPKPGQLLELAKAQPTAAFKLVGRVQGVLASVDQVRGIQRRAQAMIDDGVKSEEQRQAVVALLADFRSKSLPVVERAQRVLQRGVKGADIPDAELPYIGGIVPPGRGITREMMRKLGLPEPPPDHVTDAGPPVDDAPIFSED